MSPGYPIDRENGSVNIQVCHSQRSFELIIFINDSLRLGEIKCCAHSSHGSVRKRLYSTLLQEADAAGSNTPFPSEDREVTTKPGHLGSAFSTS